VATRNIEALTRRNCSLLSAARSAAWPRNLPRARGSALVGRQLGGKEKEEERGVPLIVAVPPDLAMRKRGKGSLRLWGRNTARLGMGEGEK